MRKFLYSLCACLCMALVSSCSTDDDSNYASKTFAGCFAYVNDMPSGATATYKGVTYELSIFYGNNRAQLKISGLQLPDGTRFPTMTLKDLRWKMDKYGWYDIEASGIKPSLSNYGKVPEFTTLKVRYCDRYVGGASSPGLALYYILDSQYSVTSASAGQIVFGDLTSVNLETGDEFKDRDCTYSLNFNMDTRRLEISMKQAKFVGNMPMRLDIVLKNIPFTISGTTARWNVDAITPEIGGTPYPAFPITDLAGEYDFGDGLQMKFYCEPAPGGHSLGYFQVKVEADIAYEL